MTLRNGLLICLCGALMHAGWSAGPVVRPSAFQRGVTLTSWDTVRFARPSSYASLNQIRAVGANWVAISLTGTQSTHCATEIKQCVPRTPFDSDVEALIRAAHNHGLRVMLRPVIAVTDEAGHWHGDIGKGFTTEEQWATWFAAYEEFITHYARMARRHRVELFCVGAELECTTAREAEWRRVIAAVRRHYRGPLVYASNWSGEAQRIAWWDAVDFLGVNAYFPLSDTPAPSLDALKRAWVERGYVDAMAALAATHRKPVLITEIGYRSVPSATVAPWEFTTNEPVDLDAQATAYQAALETLQDLPWLAGIYWWAWNLNPDHGGPGDDTYTPQDKPAEGVLRQFYRRKGR